MNSVNVTKLRQHFSDYLRQIQQGEEIAITVRGKNVARIIPDYPATKRDAALNRSEALRGSVIAGDILSRSDEQWTGDADNL